MTNAKRLCKKCNCELSAFTKRKICNNCRVRRNEKIKKAIGIAAAAIITTGTTALAYALSNHNDCDTYSDSDPFN